MENGLRPIKFISHCIGFQEVPDEASLIINTTGCTHHCPGCHSEYLWEYKGYDLFDNLEYLVEFYKEYGITCVCFMGGDYNIPALLEACKYVKLNGLKTCVYSGCNDTGEEYDALFHGMYNVIDYLKIGEYIESLGGLDSATTNQKMLMRTLDNEIVDITYKFKKDWLN